MTPESPASPLASLPFLPILTEAGEIPVELAGEVGIYAIFDQHQALQYVGYSRDIALGLKQHLVRQPQACYWVKVQTVERPSRTRLEEMRQAWLAEHGAVPPGNGPTAAAWEKPIDAKQQMTPEEATAIAQADGLEQIKLLKKVARRIEATVLDQLKARGVQMDLRFNPKLKEDGLLDLK